MLVFGHGFQKSPIASLEAMANAANSLKDHARRKDEVGGNFIKLKHKN